MIIEKAILENEEYLSDLEIKGNCTKDELKKLEKIIKKSVYFLGLFGKKHNQEKVISYYSIMSDCSIFLKNNNAHTLNLDFKLYLSGYKSNVFWKNFKNKFGPILESEINYN
jgi:hypothetical protein